MLVSERHAQLLERLAADGVLRTSAMAAAFEVTDETIRKDFEMLEQRGELVRVHGGALPPTAPRLDLSLTDRQQVNLEAKRAIAKAAAERIRPKEIIFLDASSTVLTLTEFLPDFPFTVLTNAHNVVTALSGKEHLEVFTTGGLYETRSKSFVGLSAEAALRRYNINRMFCSATGFNIERGVSESNPRQAAFKERVIPCSQEVCLLADSSKLGTMASFFFASAKEVNTLITNSNANPEFTATLESLGTRIILAP
ncbi:MAG: DeoR/GlpR family DNA-binding transcription regulator [Verrucomicrobiales bacterium]